MHNPQRNTDATKERLMAICRTDLLAFGKESFGVLIDHDLSKNSASKLKQLSDFSVNSIYHELCHIVREETHHQVNLESLMADYEKASEYYRDKLKAFLMKGNKLDFDKVYAMLDYLIMADASIILERDEAWDDIWDAALDKDVDLRIVTMLALGIIPSYSGKGKVEERPLGAMKAFIHDYTEREGCPFTGRTEYHNMLLETGYNLDGRMPAVALLYHFVETSRLSFSIDSSRVLSDNLAVIPMLDVDDDELQPVIWYNEACPTTFWFMSYLQNAYYLYKCDYRNHTYTRFSLFLGSELEVHEGRILHPQSILSLLNNDFDSKQMIMMSWSCKFDANGNATELHISTMSPWGRDSEWAQDFNHLALKRLTESCREYQIFQKEFAPSSQASGGKAGTTGSGQALLALLGCSGEQSSERQGSGQAAGKDPFDGLRASYWHLTEKYSNAFPGTEYFFKYSLYSVARDHILVQDVEEKDGEFVLIDNKYFRIDKDWVDDDLNLNDSVGLIILGTDLPEEKRKKYIALDYKLLYLSVVNDEVIYPE